MEDNTEAKRARAATGEVDLYFALQEDQATNEFQERIAKLAGKEAAMFAVSGTMVSPHSTTAETCEARDRARADPRSSSRNRPTSWLFVLT